ncbi:enoyl-CoA hydratase-related protein [Rhodococcus koreensis]
MAETTYEEIRYEITGSTAVITIDREHAFNAFTSQTVEELIHAFQRASWDTDVAAVILTGAGGKSFCAGGDVKLRAKLGNYGPSESGLLRVGELQTVIRNTPKPVIAAVNGAAIGGGHVLHVVCDVTIAVEHARFGQVGPKVGSFDAGFGTAYLSRVVGEKKAREIWFWNRIYSAQEAREMNLVNLVVPADQLMETALEWAAEVSHRSPTALRFLKQSFNADSDSVAGIGQLAMSALDMFGNSEEAKEGAQAFAEKRDPEFRQHVEWHY